MARVCDICGKKTQSGGTIARRGLPKKAGGVGLRITGRTLRKFRPNLQKVRALVDGKVERVRVCTKCIKSDRIAKPSGVKAEAAS
jgi:large subunit ribosomal protein L28